MLLFKNSLKIVNLYVQDYLLFQVIISIFKYTFEKLKFNKFATYKIASKNCIYIFKILWTEGEILEMLTKLIKKYIGLLNTFKITEIHQ